MSQFLFRLTPEVFRYTCERLVSQPGIGRFNATELRFDVGEVKIYYRRPCQLNPGHRSIIVAPCRDTAFNALLFDRENSLHWIPTQRLVPKGLDLPFFDPVPVLFWGAGYEDGSKPFVERKDDGSVIFYADIIAGAFFMLSRWEETIVSTPDQHGRFPAAASVAYKQGFLNRPIVDEYALILQTWLKTLLPQWEPLPRHFSVKLSHDVDIVRSASWRRLGGDILKRRNPSKAMRSLQEIVYAEQDRYLCGFQELAGLSEANGFQSAFYFMAADRGPFDNGYNIASKQVESIIQKLRQRGHEVGFHPGYRTPDEPERFMMEKKRMDEALGKKRYGGRQHYLRFRTPYTWHLWEASGLLYDSTLCYADHEGFRCGTCHFYHPFDIDQNRQLDLLELPLMVMDGTLKQYRGLAPEAGEERILSLAKRCKQVNGVFTMLWHITSLQDEWEPWANMYRRVLPRLAELEGRPTPLEKGEQP